MNKIDLGRTQRSLLKAIAKGGKLVWRIDSNEPEWSPGGQRVRNKTVKPLLDAGLIEFKNPTFPTSYGRPHVCEITVKGKERMKGWDDA